ncbi:hypothetical protein [Ottowia sp.]|uniref:hypothetical protein n=1 Tax=Ottowia sp. TaxID=1898956 RepID=UPI003A872BD4
MEQVTTPISPSSPPWPQVIRALDAELHAWQTYADEVTAWLADLQVRVGGEPDPQRLLEHTRWVTESVNTFATRLRQHLRQGEWTEAISVALSRPLDPRGMDYCAPGFFWEPAQPGDLCADSQVGNRDDVLLLRSTFWPEQAPPWWLHTQPAWSQVLFKWLWSPVSGHKQIIQAFEAHMTQVGNP